jgi:hypothetical protein
MVWRPHDPNADDDGMVDFAPPISVTTAAGIDEGLPSDWQEYDGTVDDVSAWDVLENPLYEAAAGALDIDWDEFVENFGNEIGEEDGYERPEAERRQGGIPTMAGVAPGPAGIAANLPEFQNSPLGDDSAFSDEDEPYDWGITHEGIEGQLNEMQEWLLETISDAEDKRGYSGNGPSAADYGMDPDLDIWTVLGLDAPPEKPKALGDEYFSYEDSPSNYDKLEPWQGGFGSDNPWIDAGVWLGSHSSNKGLQYAEEYPFRGEQGATHVSWDYQRASGALTVPEPKGGGHQYDWYMEDRERNMPGNDLNPDDPQGIHTTTKKE